MERPNIVGPEYLSQLLHRRVSTIRCDAHRRPQSLPPRLQIPGTSKLIWVEADVLEWLNDLRPRKAEKPKGGRPNK
jgi:hypothetical protein